MPCDGVTHEKIKAIYPHIVVGGKPERPCYSIHWYDVESKQMICGFSSYKLSFVRKWLKEEFEDLTVGGDFDNFIQSQRAEIERLNHIRAELSKEIEELKKTVESLEDEEERRWEREVLER